MEKNSETMEETAKTPEKVVFGSKEAADVLKADRKALANAELLEKLRALLPDLKEELDLTEFEARELKRRVQETEREIRGLEA